MDWDLPEVGQEVKVVVKYLRTYGQCTKTDQGSSKSKVVKRPNPVKIDLEKDGDHINCLFLDDLTVLTVGSSPFTIKQSNLTIFWTTHWLGGYVRRVGLTPGIWSACGRERDGARGSRGEWMTMDQSNKRADLSIPSGLNPTAPEFGSIATLLTVEHWSTCITVLTVGSSPFTIKQSNLTIFWTTHWLGGNILREKGPNEMQYFLACTMKVCNL